MTPLEAMVLRQAALIRPPPVLSLSEWADEHFYLSAESAADPGRWRTMPYQRGVLDAIGDPRVEQVTWQKSSRVGATKCLNIAIAYTIDSDPGPTLMFQPTVADAQRYSKKEIAPMLRDCKRLAGKVQEPRSRESSNTILDKEFPGGSLELNGANSPAGFRARTVRVLLFDEVDGYPVSSGDEGDPIALGMRRTETYWNRKIVAVSTPASEPSRIEELYLTGDQRRYLVPCPHCGAFDELVFFREEGAGGHWMTWAEGRPDDAHFVCSSAECGQRIEHAQKRDMVEAGYWQATAPFLGHASFFIWSAYSYAANATWAQIAREYEAAKRGTADAMRVFHNTVLGKTWRVVGDAPEWERLYRRRESYAIGTVPAGVGLVTCGVDVQKGRLVYEVVGWAASKESWSIEAGILVGDTASEDGDAWALLDGLMGRTWHGADGLEWGIQCLAIDSGYNTQTVYAWAHRDPARVIACKGMATARMLLGTPSPTQVRPNGKAMARQCLVWPVGSSIGKSETYGFLRLDAPLDLAVAAYAAGYCHFPEYDEEYFRQLTAEQLVSTRSRKGRIVEEWQVKIGRENHYLDCRVYARAAAMRAGLDRMAREERTAARVTPPRPPPIHAPPEAPPPRPKPSGWLAPRGEMGSQGRRGSWLRR